MNWPTILILRIMTLDGPCTGPCVGPWAADSAHSALRSPAVNVKKAFDFGKPVRASMVPPAQCEARSRRDAGAGPVSPSPA